VAPLPVPASWYAVPLRLIVGFGFVQHGYAKLSRGADEFIAILHALGTPFADLFGWATITVEIGGGLLILAGAFVPVATVPPKRTIQSSLHKNSETQISRGARRRKSYGPISRRV
jgi:putative oxidoreductase